MENQNQNPNPNNSEVKGDSASTTQNQSSKMFTQDQVNQFVTNRLANHNKEYEKLETLNKTLDDQLKNQSKELIEIKNQLSSYQKQINEYQTKEKDTQLENIYSKLNTKKDTFTDFKKLVTQEELAETNYEPDKVSKLFSKYVEKYPAMFLEKQTDPTTIVTNVAKDGKKTFLDDLMEANKIKIK